MKGSGFTYTVNLTFLAHSFNTLSVQYIAVFSCLLSKLFKCGKNHTHHILSNFQTGNRRGSRKNTDLFPKLNERRRRKLSGKSGGMLSLETFLEFNLTPLSPFSWVSESFRQDIGQFHLPWMKPCNLKSLVLLKIYYENSDRFP